MVLFLYFSRSSGTVNSIYSADDVLLDLWVNRPRRCFARHSTARGEHVSGYGRVGVSAYRANRIDFLTFLDSQDPDTPIRPYADPCPLASLREAFWPAAN
jgi:hypothetical protein